MERLRDQRGLALRDLRPLDRPDGTPEGIDFASALADGDRRVAVVASRRDGLDLLGWARVAVSLCEGRGVDDAIVAAPALSARTIGAAQRDEGSGLRVRLVAAPVLAEKPEEVGAAQVFPHAESTGAWWPTSSALLDRVVRVIEGGAIVSGSGALRRAGDGYVLYVRGVRVLRLGAERDGVTVSFAEPERRHIHVTELNFARWGLELHEMVVQLAQDPRLLEAAEARRERAAEAAAAAASVRVTARWLPWSDDGSSPIDWVGLDPRGRPVLGAVRGSVRVADVPELAAGLHALREALPLWIPGARGRPRLLVICERMDPAARALLAELDLDVESRAPEAPESAEGRERRGRRRTRRRRRGRAEERPPAREEGALARDADAEPESRGAAEADAGEGEPASEASAPAALEEDEAEELGESEAELAAEGARPEAASAEAPERDHVAEAEGGLEPARWAAEAESPAAEAEAELATSPTAEVAEVAEADEEDEGEEQQPEEARPLRRRRPRAAIAVRRDPEAVLAALVLARERRHIPFFWVCDQDELMDFFRGKATDLDENSDLLLVGFTAQPLPKEILSAAELYRGRIQWLDDHEWPIEDLEALRDAIGADAVVTAEGASSPLAAVMAVTERRSRFTDKLVDMSARRLSESDMHKWGYRLVGLLRSLTSSTGDQRSAIQAVLAGKLAELPDDEAVYEDEERWLREHDPRVVYFGEYQMAVVRVPRQLDTAEMGRRARVKTGARLSLASREGDELVVLGCNDEKRHVNLMGIVDRLDADVAWAHARPAGDRSGRFQVEALSEHPERIEAVIGEIVRHKSILYG